MNTSSHMAFIYKNAYTIHVVLLSRGLMTTSSAAFGKAGIFSESERIIYQ